MAVAATEAARCFGEANNTSACDWVRLSLFPGAPGGCQRRLGPKSGGLGFSFAGVHGAFVLSIFALFCGAGSAYPDMGLFVAARPQNLSSDVVREKV